MKSFRLLALAAVASAVVVAGCTSPAGPSAVVKGAGPAAVVGADAAALFTSKPFTGGQQTPGHIFLQQSDGRFLFYHFNEDDVSKATGLMFVGDAFPGKFCLGSAGVTQAQKDAGYVHFHKKSAPNWDAGHGGAPTYSAEIDGYWFRHIGAVDATMQMMGDSMTVRKGQVFPLMPSDQIPPCTGMGMGMGPGGAMTLGQHMAMFYTSTPLVGGQKTPAHLFFEEPDGGFLFLHFDNDEVAQSNVVLFAGDAFPGKFCLGSAGVTQAQKDAGYVHFHKKSAPNWDAGHGGAPTYSKDIDGYWFRHIGAVDATMQMMGDTMSIVKGQVFPLMPSDQVPAC